MNDERTVNIDGQNLMIEGRLPDDRACIHCGCTEDDACEGGCVWLSQHPDVCSACLGKANFTPEELESIGHQLGEVAAAAAEATDKLQEMEAHTQVLVNMLTVMVNREGASTRISKIELDGIHGARLVSKADPEDQAVILSVVRFDPVTGEPSTRLVLPGYIPPIGG